MKIRKTLITNAAAGALVLGTACGIAIPAFAQNVTVDGSLCVGNDCNTNPPSPGYGFDTQRLMENNIRILSMDTSNLASFPTRDWQIEFNSSSNGGQNYFMIRDCGNTATTGSDCGGTAQLTIEGGADNESIHVDSAGNQGGNVGFGTATPALDLDVLSGNTPTLRLQQDGSSGFAPQTWDVAGNETNFFIRDVTFGSRLPLRIQPNAPSNLLFLSASGGSGRIGIGTSSPTAKLQVQGRLLVNTVSPGTINTTFATPDVAVNSGRVELALVSSNSDDWRIQNFNNGTFRITKAGTGVSEMSLDSSGNVIFQGTVSANNGGATLPDYVFEPDYKLMPLGDLAQFVREHKHLPNVPNKKDVAAANGVLNMSEMQYRLLEKIEELTLYTIDMEKRIAKLTVANAVQQSTINKLAANLEIEN